MNYGVGWGVEILLEHCDIHELVFMGFMRMNVVGGIL